MPDVLGNRLVNEPPAMTDTSFAALVEEDESVVLDAGDLAYIGRTAEIAAEDLALIRERIDDATVPPRWAIDGAIRNLAALCEALGIAVPRGCAP